MIHREDTYQSFQSRIRNADSHADAEDILEDLTLSNIRRLAQRLAQERGEEVEHNCWVFENSAFYVLYDRALADTLIKRKPPGDPIDQWKGVVFREANGSIEVFKPLRVWSILNFFEEILETGEISI